MGKIGRPTKLTKKNQEMLCSYIQKGHTFDRACRLCKISVTSFCEWKARGLEDIKKGVTSIYSEFAEAVLYANELAIDFHLENVNRQSVQDWKASKFFLENKCRGEFSNIQTINHSGEIKINQDTENIEKRIEELLELRKKDK